MPMQKELNIVLIDDSRPMLESLTFLISNDGHSVSGATSGERGIELIREIRPDMVISDIDLKEGINGYGVARAVRMNRDLMHTYMVSLSGNNYAEDRDRSARAGFNAHVGKPMRFSRIQELICAALCHRNARSAGAAAPGPVEKTACGHR